MTERTTGGGEDPQVQLAQRAWGPGRLAGGATGPRGFPLAYLESQRLKHPLRPGFLSLPQKACWGPAHIQSSHSKLHATVWLFSTGWEGGVWGAQVVWALTPG